MHRLRAGCSPQQLAALHPRCNACHHQRRWNTDHTTSATEAEKQRESTPLSVFVRHKEPDGQIWYTMKSRLQRIKPIENPVFFEMPNIVIDLDAEGLKGVREYNYEDDEKMEAQWAQDSKRPAAQREVNRLQETVAWMRRSWEDILAQPLTPWRINHHDIMSVALRGTGKVVLGTERRQITTREDPAFLQLLCGVNGIPAYATQDDKSAIEWMLLRKSALEQHVSEHPDRPLTTFEVAKAIQRTKSLMELRRVMAACSFGSLGNEKDNLTAFAEDGVVSSAIKSAIGIMLQECEPGSPLITEALIVLGNIEMSLLEEKPHDSAVLWGVALHLASWHSLTTIIECVRRGIDSGLALALPENIEHLLVAVETLITRIDDPDAPDIWQLDQGWNRRLLFPLLTGTTEDAQGISIRSLALSNVFNEVAGLAPKLRADLFKCYIALLGRVGAVRTLWVEAQVLFRSSPGGVQATKAEILEAIIRAAANAPLVEEGGEVQLVSEEYPSFEACVSKDDEVITAHTKSFEGRSGGAGSRSIDTSRLKEALEGGLDGWLRELSRR